MATTTLQRERRNEERMELFLNVIRKYETDELRKIKQKSADEQEFEVGKIMNEAKEKEEEAFGKRVKNVQVQAKIRKSRKSNELKLSVMKVRFQMIEKIQSDVKSHLLDRICDSATYKALLEGLLYQGMIKMLEESLEVKCLKRDQAIVLEAIASAEHRFREDCVVTTKLQLSKEYLPESELGGIVLTSLKGRIVCNNTMRARLDYALQLSLPDVRAMLFSKN